MMQWKLEFSLFIGLFCCALTSATNESLPPNEWFRLVSVHEVPALKAFFKRSLSLNSIDIHNGEQAIKLLEKMEAGLIEKGSEAELKVQSLRYIALTDRVSLGQLHELCSSSACPTGLVDALQRLDGLIYELQKEVQEDSLPGYWTTLKNIETSAQVSQEEILRNKQIEATLKAILRIQALADVAPGESTRLKNAISDLRAGVECLRENKDELAEVSFKKGYAAAFGEKAERWDGRHLSHFLSTKVLALNVARSGNLSESERKLLLDDLTSLEGATSIDDYDARAGGLQTLLTQIIEKYDLAVSDPDVALAISPEAVRDGLSAQIEAMEKWATEARQLFLEKETVTQWANYKKKYRLLLHLRNLQAKLHWAKNQLQRTENFEVIRATRHALFFFQNITTSLMESILERSDAVDLYMDAWMNGLTRMAEEGRPFMTDSDYHKVREALRIECREGIYRAWVNRKNASVAALSVLLTAEAISIPFTGGGSAAAMPATLSAITSISVVGAKTLLFANSALNLADRAKINGPKGLANMDSAFDVMVILSLSPRPTIGGTPATSTVGKLTQYSMTKLAQFQYSSATFLSVAGPTYGAYLAFNAESISNHLAKEGVLVTPEEVRRRGLVNIAFGILSYTMNSAYYRQGVAQNGDAFEKAIEPGTFSGGTLKQWGKTLNQPGAIMEYRANHPGSLRAAMTAGKVASLALMDYLLVTEALLLSFTNPDTVYLNHAYAEHPLPDLREAETAVVVVGFDPSDYFLWAGANARYSHHREIAKYGDKFFIYNYESPENLLEVLKRHRQENGPIRFLKIATHGRPGRLYTREVWGSPEGKLGAGWINDAFLEGNRERLQKLSKNIFAPDARLLLWACLVGTNLDNSVDGDPVNVGDLFLQNLGDTLLVNGGSIDASTRVLLGWDATAGVLGDYLQREGFRTVNDGKPRFVIPVRPLVEDPSPEIPRDDKSEVSLSLLQIGKSMANRLYTLYTDRPPVWWKYGVNLEGPHWKSRYYKYIEVKAH